MLDLFVWLIWFDLVGLGAWLSDAGEDDDDGGVLEWKKARIVRSGTETD